LVENCSRRIAAPQATQTAANQSTLKDGVVEKQNFNDDTVARITDVLSFSVHIVPSAKPPTGVGEPGLPPLAPAL
jgi:CO/xanthine dehydrogenase Mo-binding subunit